MRKQKIFTTFLFLFFLETSFSQINFNRNKNISVFENNIELSNPWNGGINSSQFSAIDLNMDGVKDLVLFDRSGNKLSPYLNINGEYTFAPEYRIHFPKIESWMLLEDYNCDGLNDLFTYSNAGISVYMNSSTTSLSFSMTSSHLINSSTGLVIYVSPMDIPAISDVDNDGDLDILTFEITGVFVNYFKNKSIENHGNCNQLEYEHETGCWGNFYEGLNTYTLNCLNCMCPPISNNNYSKISKHAGSSVLAIDIDNDNDKDLILGDVSYNNLNLLINGGDNTNANIIYVDTIFPSNTNNTLAADIHIFPAPFYVDVTNDGFKDLLISTNLQNNSENHESSWLYENIGTNNNPDFNFIKKDFLQSSGIDLGEGAHPTLYDYNNDGLLDLFVGNYGYHDINGTPISKIAHFENIGTNNNPVFALITEDFQNISNINLNTTLNIPALNLHPSFGDLNGDGQDDLIIGDADGKIHLFINSNGNFLISNPNLSNIDVGYFATPQIFDVNNDGLNDLIIGNKSGTIYYFENQGTSTNPDFTIGDPSWGNIDVDSTYINNGFSTPKLININGENHLFVGSYSGKIYLYNNIDGNINGTFNEINSIHHSIWEGERISIALGDLNNDNLTDLIIGNICGGLAYFNGDTTISNTYNINNKNIPIIYPNPAIDYIHIKNQKNKTIQLYNLLGNIIMENTNNIINIQDIKKGMYLIKIDNKIYKFIKK